MKDRDLHEAMDACRLDSDDLQLPELRMLAERLEMDPETQQQFSQRQQLDRLMASGLRQVDIPLECRARLVAVARSVADAYAAATELPVRIPPAARLRRRLTLAALGLSAVAVLLLVLLGLRWFDPWRTIGPQQLARWAARDWVTDPRGWQPMTTLPADRQSSISSFLLLNPARWQPISTHLDENALVFDLPGHAQPTRLFVLQAHRRVKQLPTSPPPQPQTGYEGRLFAAWQEAANVYVLSVAGSPLRYRDIVRTPGDSLARATARPTIR
jgi:hypothetical protein